MDELKERENTKPEGYYWPTCNSQMARDLKNRMLETLPPLSVAMMAVSILEDSGCPAKMLKTVYEWAGRTFRDFDGLNDVEREKLNLLKWQEWATK